MNSEVQEARYAGLLRIWRRRRRVTQRSLALDAEVSHKHISALETGRVQPSRRTVLQIAASLDVPLRDRNQMLAAAGFDPEFQERQLVEQSFEALRGDVEAILTAHEPHPAIAIDRHWRICAANRGVGCLFIGAELSLLQPPINLMRLCLHPGGLAPRIINLAPWRSYLIGRLRRQIGADGDPVLRDLLEEVRDYPVHGSSMPVPNERTPETAAVPLRIATVHGILSFVGTTMMFGAAADIALAEISIESFLPGDIATGAVLRRQIEAGEFDGSQESLAALLNQAQPATND